MQAPPKKQEPKIKFNRHQRLKILKLMRTKERPDGTKYTKSPTRIRIAKRRAKRKVESEHRKRNSNN